MATHGNTSHYQSINHLNKRGRTTEMASDFNSTYEHFPVVCPTCKGCGEIDEDAGGGMVTFVPVKDERLRPAWTKLKIVTLVMFILSVGGVVTYFLYPRHVVIFVNAHEVLAFDFDGKFPWIEYSYVINVKNDNFFPIKMTSFVMQLLYAQLIVGRKTVEQSLTVDIRSVKTLTSRMNVSYDVANSNKWIKTQCYQSRDYIPQLMASSAELSYWMHNQHIESKDDYFYIDCAAMVFPLPTEAMPTTIEAMPTTTEAMPTTTEATTTTTEATTTTITPYPTTPNTTSSILLSTANQTFV